MTRRLTLALCAFAVVAVLPGTALAQKSLADVLGRPATAEGQPKKYLEEIMLFSYVENSYVWNLGRTGRGDVNELRFYDHDNGYTFNAAELSVTVRALSARLGRRRHRRHRLPEEPLARNLPRPRRLAASLPQHGEVRSVRSLRRLSGTAGRGADPEGRQMGDAGWVRGL